MSIEEIISKYNLDNFDEEKFYEFKDVYYKVILNDKEMLYDVRIRELLAKNFIAIEDVLYVEDCIFDSISEEEYIKNNGIEKLLESYKFRYDLVCVKESLLKHISFSR